MLQFNVSILYNIILQKYIQLTCRFCYFTISACSLWPKSMDFLKIRVGLSTILRISYSKTGGNPQVNSYIYIYIFSTMIRCIWLFKYKYCGIICCTSMFTGAQNLNVSWEYNLWISCIYKNFNEWTHWAIFKKNVWLPSDWLKTAPL